MSGNDDISLKEYVESRLCAIDKRVDTAVQNIKESTASAFVASQKAIDKQENFQTTYNIGHNDLSRKMENQYKEMIPRAEHEIEIKRLSEDIKSLRESRSQSEGKGLGNRELLAYIITFITIVTSLFILFSKFTTQSPAATVVGSTVTATGK